MCVVYFICSFQLRALMYVLCAFVILNKDYLLTYLLIPIKSSPQDRKNSHAHIVGMPSNDDDAAMCNVTSHLSLTLDNINSGCASKR